MPQVVNMHTPDLWPADGLEVIIVDRRSKWGNQFLIGRDGTRLEVIAKYKEWLATCPELLASIKKELGGRHLACWCAPRPCHADHLLELANA